MDTPKIIHIFYTLWKEMKGDTLNEVFWPTLYIVTHLTHSKGLTDSCIFYVSNEHDMSNPIPRDEIYPPT